MALNSNFVSTDAKEGDPLLKGLSGVLAVFGNPDKDAPAEVQSLREFVTAFPITLMVGGFIVSGKVIPEADYLRLLGTEHIHKTHPADGDLAPLALSALARVYQKLIDEGIARGEHYEMGAFIHLRDARILTAAGVPIGGIVPLWRGRVIQVDGFVLDEIDLGASEEPPFA